MSVTHSNLFFQHSVLVWQLFTINFVSTDMDESLYSNKFCRLKEDMSSQNIILSELKWVSKRIINMSLSCKMHDCVYLLSFQHEVDKIWAAYIPLDELIIWERFDYIQVLKAGTIYQFILALQSMHDYVTLNLQSSLSKLMMLNWGYFLTSNRTTWDALKHIKSHLNYMIYNEHEIHITWIQRHQWSRCFLVENLLCY